MPIDRFHEIPLKATKGDIIIITITSYYGAKSSSKRRYPLKMDFEVLRWPTTTNLRVFAYSFAHHWLDRILLPLQSSDMKWHKITIRFASSGQDFQVPLVGKYGAYQGAQTPGKLFEVRLISSSTTNTMKSFKLRGVADAYEQFDRPEADNSRILENTHALEEVLVSPFSLGTAEGQENTLLRYVRVAMPHKKGLLPEPKKTPKLSAIQFTAAFCRGFR